MKSCFVCLVLLLSGICCRAAIIRVDNNPLHAADFTDLQAALDDEGTMNGDTILVAPSPNGYGSITISKQLTIYGAGYFFEENADKSAQRFTAQVSAVNFASGSEGTLFSGMDVAGAAFVNAINITLKRNLIDYVVLNASQAVVVQNFISRVGNTLEFSSSVAVTGVIVSNNIIHNTSATTTTFSILMSDDDEATITNNIILNRVARVENSTVKNNLFPSGFLDALGRNDIVTNNISAGNTAGLSNYEGNLETDDPIFAGGDSPDAQYVLADGSPAIGFGEGGVDAGIFGGPDPYVVSGIPPIPNIVELEAPLFISNSSGLTVRVKARANN